MSGDGRGLGGIAVLGMACRFPGAAGPEALWRNLSQGVESVHFFSDAELREAGVAAELLADPRYVKAKAILAGVERFDAAFFGFTPRMAELTDPQQRLFLECAWEALESAGYDPHRYRGDIGVFAGTGFAAYLLSNLGALTGPAGPGAGDALAGGAMQTAIGNRTDHLCTMVAYKLDLRGPAVTVQTTCSTSLVAVHLACQSLLDYQCDMALAGGVSIEVPQLAGYLYAEGGIGSPDGHCRPFDAGAQGTVGGSGCGAVLLKRLDEASADGDPVRAVILGSAVNNDGAVKIGYSAPSAAQQARAIAMAQAVAGVRPEEITYVETHGTGTQLGDPIEVAALKTVFATGTWRRGSCALGSVKSNFGHLDTAAGIAGLIKTVLALEHRQIPPTLHFERPPPQAGLDESPFYVNAVLRDWPAGGGPRRAGVSSFGIGGTNAHVVLAEAPEPAAAAPSRPWQLLLLSARSGAALEAASERLRLHLAASPRLPLADVAFTLQVGRRAFDHRRAVLCRDDAEEASQLLASLDPLRVYGGTREPRRQPVAFLFPGQGAQYPGMGRQLYAAEPELRRQVDLCSEILRPLLGLDLAAALAASGEEGRDCLDWNQTGLAQPALFVVEYALARLWMSWGIAPVAMLGHSLGEYVAACLAGVWPLAAALRLVAARGRLMQALPAGAMLAVHLAPDDVAGWLGGEVALAAVNRPSHSVLSGPRAAIDRIAAELAGRGVACRRLHTSHAFHSPMVEPMLAAFRDEVRQSGPQPPSLPYLSNLTGNWIRGEEATDPEYWVRHLRETVQFSAAAGVLLRDTEAVLLEVGPGITLATLARQHPARAPGRVVLSSLRPPRQGDPEAAALLATLGRLWLAGVECDWQGFYAHERRRRVELPTYPFERQRYWLPPARPGGERPGGAGPAAHRRADAACWFYAPSWRRSQLPAAAAAPAGGAAPPSPRAGLRPRPGRWLVFAGDEEPLALGLLARLAESGLEVIRVVPGRGFAALGDGAWRIDPRRREDYAALLAALDGRDGLPERLLHLWTVTPAAADPADPARQREQLDLGFHSLVFLAQALGRAALPAAAALEVVTSNAQEVVGGDLWWPEKAAVAGVLRAMAGEIPGLRCRGIDVAAPPDQGAAEALAELVLGELLSAAGEPLAAYRGRHRWLPDFAPLALPSRPAAAVPPARLRPRGSYLITGGLGGVGLTLAEELARSVQARLTLVGRSGVPPREAWDGWLAGHAEDDPTSRRLLGLRRLEALGAEVQVLAADVASGPAAVAAVAAAHRRFGALHGVIHAAGIAGGGLLALREPAQIERVLAPKVMGTRALAAALRPGELDFFVLCSSRSVFLGGAGGADYAAANAFLDAFAHAERAAWGDALVSVGWCAWREVGMLAAAAARAGAEVRAAPDEAGEATPHPLLERRQAGAGGEVYHTRLSSRRHWVADEHRIAGHPVIPGTAYLEMARAAFEQRTGQAGVELYDVFFLTPVRLRDDEERLLRLTVEPEGGGLAFRIASRAAEGGWQEAMLGRMRPLAAAPPTRQDLAAIRGRCARGERLAIDEDERFEDLGPRWQNVKQVYLGSGEVLGALELAPEFAGDLAQHKLHPSLLDRAAGLGEQFLIDPELGFYLPLSYASLQVHAPLPRKLYSHVRIADADYARHETISFDVTLMDEEGRCLAAIAGYSKKRVNNAAEQLRALAGAPGTGAAAPQARRQAAGGWEAAFAQTLAMGITPAEGQEVFRRLLAHRLPAQVVISTSDLAAVVAAAAGGAGRTPAAGDVDREGVPGDAMAAGAAAGAGLSAAPAAGAAGAVGDAGEGGGGAGHPRPALDTRFVAPRGEVEQRLAALWREALGLAEVGVDDNFFELGGDSIVGLQIVARALRLGLQISPGQLFEYQTVARLAQAVAADRARLSPAPPAVDLRADPPVPAASAPPMAAGDVPLVPNQLRFFERGYANPHRANVTQLFEVHMPLDWPRFAALLPRLGRVHDALRLRFFPLPAGGWRQELAAAGSGLPFVLLDLAALPAARQSAAVESAADALQGSLHLSRGPLARLAGFHLGHGRPSRLLFTGHHLALDHVSLYVLADDLERLYTAASAGRAPAPAAPSVSFKTWAERLDRAADAAEVEREAAWWLGLPWSEVGPLPRDRPGGENTIRSARQVSAQLDVEETRSLLDELPRALGCSIEEALLAATAWTLAEWSGAPVQLLQRVVHGRTPRLPDLDVARTVGWFAADYPLVLDLAGASDARQALPAVARQLRQVPGDGLGYGLLRYRTRHAELAARFRALPVAEVSFNYLGGQGLRRAAAAAFREAAESPGSASDPAARRPSLLNVTAWLTGRRLRLDWTYGAEVHRASTVERLAARCRATLAGLLAAADDQPNAKRTSWSGLRP